MGGVKIKTFTKIKDNFFNVSLYIKGHIRMFSQDKKVTTKLEGYSIIKILKLNT